MSRGQMAPEEGEVKHDGEGRAPAWGETKVAAYKFLAWQEQHIAAPRHNLVVSTVYALTSFYKDTVAVMPKLVFYATMNTSGRRRRPRR
jgi:hypothetical protein